MELKIIIIIISEFILFHGKKKANKPATFFGVPIMASYYTAKRFDLTSLI